MLGPVEVIYLFINRKSRESSPAQSEGLLPGRVPGFWPTFSFPESLSHPLDSVVSVRVITEHICLFCRANWTLMSLKSV